ncbi:hypothetical protein T09_9809 [Trichinella sp. T9]|nr:hypothetical protein T09_9809 [Trichinella sp. T9]
MHEWAALAGAIDKKHSLLRVNERPACILHCQQFFVWPSVCPSAGQQSQQQQQQQQQQQISCSIFT